MHIKFQACCDGVAGKRWGTWTLQHTIMIGILALIVAGILRAFISFLWGATGPSSNAFAWVDWLGVAAVAVVATGRAGSYLAKATAFFLTLVLALLAIVLAYFVGRGMVGMLS